MNSRFSIKNIHLLEILIFLLVLMSEIPRIYVFANMTGVSTVINLLQLPLYVGMLYIILKKKYNRKQLFTFSIIGGILLIGYIQSGQAAYLRGFLLILATKNFPFKKIIFTCRMAISSVFVLSLMLWVLGISDSGIGRRGKIALGYVHPNIAAQVLMIIMLLWLVEKGKEIKYKHYLFFECVAIGAFLITGTKTSIIVMAMAPFVIEVTKRILIKKRNAKLSFFMLQMSQMLILVFTYISAKLLPVSSLLKKLDLLLTNRLFLNYYLLNKYPLKMFGQNVLLQDNSGTVYNNIQNVWNVVITCDSTYIESLIIMGIIPTALFLVGYILVVKKAIRNKNYIIVSTAIILALYAFCESQMIEIYNNFVYFYILSLYDINRKGREEIL